MADVVEKQGSATIAEDVVSSESAEQTKSLPANDEPILPTAPREDLIATAAKFLENPKVRQSPFAQRRAFLEKKGLTKTEIDLAVLRSGTAADESALAVGPVVAPRSGGNISTPSVGGYVAAPQMAIPPPSGWTRLRDSASLAIFLSGAAFAAYHLYQKYIEPVLSKNRPAKPDPLVDVNRTVDEMRRSMADIVAVINNTQGLVKSQQRQLDELVRVGSLGRGPQELERVNVSEIKEEIRSLKALLLSRKQFPPGPVTTPIIPSWQRQNVQFQQQQPQQQDEDGAAKSNCIDAADSLLPDTATSFESTDSLSTRTVTTETATPDDQLAGSDVAVVLREDTVVDGITFQKSTGQDDDVVSDVARLVNGHTAEVESHDRNGTTEQVVDCHVEAN